MSPAALYWCMGTSLFSSDGQSNVLGELCFLVMPELSLRLPKAAPLLRPWGVEPLCFEVRSGTGSSPASQTSPVKPLHLTQEGHTLQSSVFLCIPLHSVLDAPPGSKQCNPEACGDQGLYTFSNSCTCQRSWDSAQRAKENFPCPLILPSLEPYLQCRCDPTSSPGSREEPCSFRRVPRYTQRDAALHHLSERGLSKCHRVLEGFQPSVTELCAVYRHPSLRVVRLAAQVQPRARRKAQLPSLLWLWVTSVLQHPNSVGRATT